MRIESSADTRPASTSDTCWRDPRGSPGERAEAFLPLMSLEEKLARLVGVWVGARASATVPAQTAAASRCGIPAQVHEKCLRVFAAWRRLATLPHGTERRGQ